MIAYQLSDIDRIILDSENLMSKTLLTKKELFGEHRELVIK
jgi:hypothetical protein